ncbi:unnamed protein product, partial [Mesorhabditis spiculigera]
GAEDTALFCNSSGPWLNERNLCHFYYTARINTRCVDVDKCNMVAFRCPKARIELTLAAIGALLLLVASSSLLIYRVLVLIYPRMAYTGTANIAKREQLSLRIQQASFKQGHRNPGFSGDEPATGKPHADPDEGQYVEIRLDDGPAESERR